MIDNLPSRYEIRKTCGIGRFATVYHAFDHELQRDVALKVSDLTNRDSNEQSRLKRELRISCKLRHPAIASGFDGFEQGSHVVLSLPLLTGGTLQEYVGKTNDSSESKLRRFIALCGAVQYIHRNGLLHADIKPDNVLLDENGKPFLTDFGSAMTIKQPTQEVVGTAAYLAPELVRGQSSPSVATDIYSLGATLYYLLTGKPPFDGEPHAILHAIRTQPFPSIRKQCPDISRSLEAILAVACHTDAQSRYKTADDLRIDVERFLDDQPIAARSVGPVGRAWLLAKRNPTSAKLMVALGAVVLVGTIISTVGWIRSDSQRRSLDQSTIVLERRVKEVSEHESSLQTMLATITAEKKSIDEATANEVHFRSQAATARDQALQASQLAEARLLESQKLSSMAETLKKSSGELDSQIVQTERLVQEQEAFNREREIRDLATNAMIAALEANESERWYDAEELLKGVPIAYQDSTYQRLKKLIAKQKAYYGTGFDTIRQSRRPDPKRVIYSRDSSKAIVLTGGNTVEFIVFGENDVPVSYDERTIEAFARRRIPQNAAFDSTGEQVAIAYQSQSDDTKHAVVVRNVGQLGSDNRIFEMEFDGEVSAMRINDQNDIFVIRNNRSTKDIEIYDVKSAKVLWSCRESRKQGGEQGSAPDNTPVLPWFIEVGTKPWEHVLFASSPEPAVGVPTSVFLHSVDLRSTPKITSHDCGPHDLSRWPHSWYVSDHVSYGLGQECLSTQDPPRITNLRFANVERQLGKTDQFALSKCTNGWQPILSRPETALKSSYLEASLFHDWLSPSFSGRVQGNSPNSRIPTPRLDVFTGRLIYGDYFAYPFTFDLIGQQVVPLPSSRDLKVPKGFVAIGSEQRNRVIAINLDYIQACTAYDWNPNAYHSVDAMSARLVNVANRLREASTTADPLLANSQSVDTPQSYDTVIRPSGGYIDCQSGRDGFSLPNVRINDRSAKTLEAVVNLDAIKRTDHPCIVGSNFGLALKFDPKNSEFYLENPQASGTDNASWVGVNSGPVLMQQWIHVAGCFDGVDQYSIYVNGKLGSKEKVAFKPNADPATTDLVVNAFGSLFGKLDAVRVSELQRYMEDFVPALPLRSDENTIALYQFDESEGNTVIDSSGRGNHGWIEHPVRGNASE